MLSPPPHAAAAAPRRRRTLSPLLLLATAGAADAAASGADAAASGGADAALLLPGKGLKAGESITAGSGFLVMQMDGNLAVCATLDSAATSCGSELLWGSGTAGNIGSFVTMQEDGVLSVL